MTLAAERGGTCNVHFWGSSKGSWDIDFVLLPDALLGPFQVTLCLACSFEPLVEIGADTFQTSLS